MILNVIDNPFVIAQRSSHGRLAELEIGDLIDCLFVYANK